MTIHEFLVAWFDYNKDRTDDVNDIIDGFFGYLAACGLEIKETGDEHEHTLIPIRKMVGRKMYTESFCQVCKKFVRDEP